MKKGFTLVELLGVIVILMVIFSITLPAIINVTDSSKDTVYQKKINDILTSAYNWSLENAEFLPERDNVKYITVGELKKKSLLDSDIKDPKTGEYFSDDLVIEIKNIGSNRYSKSKYSKKSGDYLFTIKRDDRTSSLYKEQKPSIVLEGLNKDSAGNYTVSVNLGSDFSMPSYNATSKDGANLASRVVFNITKNDIIVDTIDTTKLGIYYVNYTVVDDYGYSTVVDFSVIIKDLEAPNLVIPENTTISSSVNEYDLMEGVSCTDNSGDCSISIEGKINFGVKDKYIITYIAKDPSGNQVSSKRVITVE